MSLGRCTARRMPLAFWGISLQVKSGSHKNHPELDSDLTDTNAITRPIRSPFYLLLFFWGDVPVLGRSDGDPKP